MSNFKIRVSHGQQEQQYTPICLNPINATNYILGEGTGNLIQGMASNSDELGNLILRGKTETNYGIDMGFLNNGLIYRLIITIYYEGFIITTARYVYNGS